MKYFKIFVISLPLVLSACSTMMGNKKAKVDSAKVQPAIPTVMSTVRYIPVREKNPETGMIVPYVASANPYLQQKKQLPPQAVGQFIAAKRDFQLKNYKSAEVILTRLTGEYKTLSGPWVLKGDIYVAQEKHDQAIKAFEQAIKVNKTNVNAYLRLALNYRVKGDFIAAQNTYARALKLWRDFPEAHLNLAILYDLYMNKSLEAQRHLEAYQFLTNGKDKKVAKWLKEVQTRTGEAIALQVERKKAVSSPAVSGGQK